jgi:hypothetical protein
MLRKLPSHAILAEVTLASQCASNRGLNRLIRSGHGFEGLQTMMSFSRRMALGAAVVALLFAAGAAAQENLDSGKTPAQLYASDCAICHKSPRGLSQGGGILGLQNFLREHYTASREAAAAIAAYVAAMNRGAPAPEAGAKRVGKPKEKAKAGEAKSASPKSEPKGSEPAQPQAKPAEGKPADAAPAEPKAAEQKPVEAKADAGKPAAKPAAETKPDTEKKSD